MGVHDKGQIIGSNWVQSRQGTLMAMMMMTGVVMMIVVAPKEFMTLVDLIGLRWTCCQ